MDSPGGWRLIGKTPVKMYDPLKKEPILTRAGEYIRFCPISLKEFQEIEEAVAEDRYEVRWHKGE